MTPIKIMDERLANQIAAGEVVERPASVVKELVENALDAHAKNIQVHLEEAGLKLIQVRDDGDGIPRDEVKLAFERHATSKLLHSDELFRIRTLGFRGEALPSIASVSRLTIESAVADAPGTELQLAGGKILSESSAPARQGTKVKVEQLFYNTPARLKHIKTLQTELSHVTDLLNRLALARPDVAFELIHEGHTLLRTVGNRDQKQALAAVYGVPTAKKMKKISGEDFNFKVSGYISLPEVTRASNSYITLVINGRYVKNFALNKAVEAGYGSKLMVGRHPLAVLQITLDPLLVDVNVHPTKQHVRISIEDDLGRLIKQTVAEALAEEVRIPKGFDNIYKKQSSDKENYQTTLDFYQPKSSDFRLEETPPSTPASEQPRPKENSAGKYNQDSQGTQPALDSAREFLELAAEKSASPKQEHFPALDYIGQLHGTYLLAQNEAGLYVIDQHAAQERLKYEYYRETIGTEGTAQQELLLSIMFEYPTDEALTIQNHLEQLQAAGIYLEDFGGNSFVLRTHPAWIPAGEVEATVRQMIDFFLVEEQISTHAFREATAIMMSCKRSIKANHHLSEAEAKQLLADLAGAENPYNCPHGRPTIVLLTHTDLEKMFKRIQDPH